MIAAILAWRRHRAEQVLLPRRMAALHVDSDTVERIEPAVFRNLQDSCAACRAVEQCEWDLMHNPGNPGWKDYCPNAGVLSTLGGLRLFGPPKHPWPASLERPPRVRSS